MVLVKERETRKEIKMFKEIEAQIKAANDEIARLAALEIKPTRENPRGKKHPGYYDAINRKSALVCKHIEMLEKETAERIKPAAESVKLNGYGEATERYITCPTYERAQKKLDKRFLY